MPLRSRLQAFAAFGASASILSGLLLMAAMVALVFTMAITTDPDARLSSSQLMPGDRATDSATGASTGEAGAE